MSLNISSDGLGKYGFRQIDAIVKRTFKVKITHENSKRPDLVVKSHFNVLEKLDAYDCPYISWPGENFHVQQNAEPPIFEINTFISDIPNCFYIPLLVNEHINTKRPDVIATKKYCLAYANSTKVDERNELFLRMRRLEPLCHSFGLCHRTSDSPFIAEKALRQTNKDLFREYLFNIAMENSIVPGYITEKIGNAFAAGAIPIYWGDADTVCSFFNKDAFLLVNDYRSIEEAANTAINIWRDPQKAQKYLDAPLRNNNNLLDYETVFTEYRPWQKPIIGVLTEQFPDLPTKDLY